MKKLLLVGNNQIHLKNFYDLIEGYFDKVFFITTAAPPILDLPYRALNFSLRNPFSGWRTIRQIRQVIREFKPDLIHVQQANSNAFYTLLAARKMNIPVVVTAWGSDVLVNPGKSFILKQMVKYILNKAQYFTSDAVFMAAKMVELSGKNLDILVANFGIDPVPGNAEKQNIVYSNRLHKPLYRIDKIIEAFKKFSDQHRAENWKLIIAGSGEMTAELQVLTARLSLQNQVEFAGWLNHDENISYYKKAKIYVSIPASDGTSISLLEAMDAGCMPVLSDLPANREWIVDGHNGVIVKNLEENFLEKALQLSFREVSVKNHLIIEERATRKVNRDKFFSFYNKIFYKE